MVVTLRVTLRDVPVINAYFEITWSCVAPDGSKITINRVGEAPQPFLFRRPRYTRLEGEIVERVTWPPTLTPCILTFTARGSEAANGTEVTSETTDGMERLIPVVGNEYDRAKLGVLFISFTTTLPY